MALNVRFEDFSGADPLEAELALEFPEGDICEHAFPFAEEPGLFFYCHKVPCIRVSGGFRLGGLSYRYDPSRAFAVQDWGRGVWPEHSTPCWGSAGGVVGGRLFGFNIGSRYGDTSAATENVLFYGGRAHKLEEVDFVIQDDETAFSKPWTFRSSDGRFEMAMDPVLDRHSSAPAGIRYGAEQHQVFGYYSGTAVLDDGTPAEDRPALRLRGKGGQRLAVLRRETGGLRVTGGPVPYGRRVPRCLERRNFWRRCGTAR